MYNKTKTEVWRLKKCLQINEITLRSQKRYKKGYAHNVITEKVNKITLSFNDDKRLKSVI